MSWVIIDRKTRKGFFETFNKKTADLVKYNSEKYTAIPIIDYLHDINMPIKMSKK